MLQGTALHWKGKGWLSSVTAVRGTCTSLAAPVQIPSCAVPIVRNPELCGLWQSCWEWQLKGGLFFISLTNGKIGRVTLLATLRFV